MSMDDEGWGGFTPMPEEPAAPPADAGPPTQPTLPTLPTQPAPTQPLPSQPAPGRPRRPRALMIGAPVVVVVIIVGVVVALASSKSKNNNTVVTVTTTTVPSSSPGTTLLSKADYVTQADNICLNFRDQLQAATAAGNLSLVAQEGQAELDQLRGLGDPAQDAALIRTFINNGTQAINFLIQNDLTDYNTAILAADTAAGQFGMKVCNYGH